MQHFNCMRIVQKNAWALAVLAWIGTIFFSSTSLAAQWSERAFHFFSGLLFGGLGPNDPSYGLIHLLADKGFHVALFLILAILLWKAIPQGKWKIGTVLLFGAFVGSCSEFLQRFFPGRDPAIRDVLINVAGTALGVVVALAFAHIHGVRISGQLSPTEDASVLAEKR